MVNLYNRTLYSMTTVLCMEGDHIFLSKELWTGIGRGMLFPWCILWWRRCACQFLVSAEMLNGHVVPGTSCLYAKWVHVRPGLLDILVHLVLLSYGLLHLT